MKDVAKDTSEIKAVVLGGGLRSRAVDPVGISRAFFPIVNRPSVLYTMETLSAIGIKEAFLTLDKESGESGHLAGFNGLTVHRVVEDYPRGTAGCLKQIESRLSGHTIIVISAELVFFMREDLEEMLRHHRESGADVTVGLMPVSEGDMDTERVQLGREGEVESVSRIHSSMDGRSKVRTSGMYVMESAALGHVKSVGYMDIKEQLLPKLRALGMKVVGWRHKRYHCDMRTMGDYLRVNFDLLRDHGLANGHMSGYREAASGIWVGCDVRISPSATLVRPLVIGDGTRIEEGVTLIGPSVIGERCVLGRGSFVRESVFWSDSVAPSDFEVEKCLVSGKAFSLENSHCREMVVLDGKSWVDGISAATNRPVIRRVAEKPESAWKSLHKTLYPAIKRAFDMLFSGVALLLLLPVFAAVAAAVKLDSKGPAFFRQVRNAQNGKPFWMIKFRTMVENAEELKEQIRYLNQSDGPMFKIIGDPRETRVGRLLRATNIDEIPQLLNVLRGEMSLVGPRPLSMEEMKYNPHWREARLKVTPGITGLWQIYGKESNWFHDWIRYDLRYVDQRSLWLDTKIVFVTALKMLKIL
ncbi:MAG: sugar transferase [Candidatus Lindowbacteria bacterium]|nr:sugar transferase [Candidatus Lindowbacteria bacterium]